LNLLGKYLPSQFESSKMGQGVPCYEIPRSTIEINNEILSQHETLCPIPPE
jgi:hypothetical protein